MGIFCVNIKAPQFQQLQGELGLSEFELAVHLTQYQTVTGNITIPSLNDLKQDKVFYTLLESLGDTKKAFKAYMHMFTPEMYEKIMQKPYDPDEIGEQSFDKVFNTDQAVEQDVKQEAQQMEEQATRQAIPEKTVSKKRFTLNSKQEQRKKDCYGTSQ